MKEKQVSNWEANLEDVLIQLRNQIEKERITHSTPDKLFILYTICRLVFDIVIFDIFLENFDYGF